jgi:hypothetical protein
MRANRPIPCGILIYCSFLCALGGCIYKDEPMPELVYGQSQRNSPLVSPSRQVTKPSSGINRDNGSSEWFPSSRLEKNWTAIIIHHSATENGNMAIIDKWHRENNHWDGIGYDFVIGNGTDSGNGQVEVTFRWRNQKTGAHCGNTWGNWANRDGIGICLVGNFNKTSPTPQQIQSLVKLIRFLQSRYGISRNRIYGHNTTPGANVTDCPGRHFPMAAVKAAVNF